MLHNKWTLLGGQFTLYHCHLAVTFMISRSMLITLVIPYFCPSGGDKVTMLTHTYSYKPLRKIKVTICNHQVNSPLYVWPGIWYCDLQVWKKYGHTWHRMSLLRPRVIKQPKPKPIPYFCIWIVLCKSNIWWSARSARSIHRKQVIVYHCVYMCGIFVK